MKRMIIYIVMLFCLLLSFALALFHEFFAIAFFGGLFLICCLIVTASDYD